MGRVSRARKSARLYERATIFASKLAATPAALRGETARQTPRRVSKMMFRHGRNARVSPNDTNIPATSRLHCRVSTADPSVRD
jgi:hypothetical protein